MPSEILINSSLVVQYHLKRKDRFSFFFLFLSSKEIISQTDFDRYIKTRDVAIFYTLCVTLLYTGYRIDANLFEFREHDLINLVFINIK